MTNHRRLVAAPISWGICEVPGWGRMLDAERVLGEMASLGITATELGAPGFLPDDAAALRDALARHGLGLVGQLLARRRARAVAIARRLRARDARKLAALGGDVISLALVQDMAWSAPRELSDAQWATLAATVAEAEAAAAAGGRHARAASARGDAGLHRGAGRAGAAETVVRLVPGHRAPVPGRGRSRRVRRRARASASCTSTSRTSSRRRRAPRHGELSLLEAVQAGLFVPLGEGDAGVARAIAELDRAGYSRWWVLEQDTAITGPEPAAGKRARWSPSGGASSSSRPWPPRTGVSAAAEPAPRAPRAPPDRHRRDRPRLARPCALALDAADPRRVRGPHVRSGARPLRRHGAGAARRGASARSGSRSASAGLARGDRRPGGRGRRGSPRRTCSTSS